MKVQCPIRRRVFLAILEVRWLSIKGCARFFLLGVHAVSQFGSPGIHLLALSLVKKRVRAVELQRNVRELLTAFIARQSPL